MELGKDSVLAVTTDAKLQKERSSDSADVMQNSERCHSPYDAQRAEPKPHEQPVYVDPHYAECSETCHRICDAQRFPRCQSNYSRSTPGKLYTIFGVRRPSPHLPQLRYGGYDRLEDADYSLPLRFIRAIIPELVKVKHTDRWWLEDYSLPKDEKARWMDRLTLSSDSTFSKHLHAVREQAWQEVQEFCIARWWFLRNRLQMSPYYSEIVDAAREGASVADLACGFGQDLRYLRDDGVTGKMWAVDICPTLWELGTQLFADAPGPAEFIEADLVDRGYENPCALHALHNKVDIFLLNDYLSFLGSQVIRKSLATIAYTSRPGSKIVGWAFGNNQLDHMGLHSPEIWGDGLRGVIHHPDAFREQTWRELEEDTKTKWDLRIELLEPEEFGFTADELRLIWGQRDRPLKVLYFMATRET